jgi:hypothetical protein
LAFRKSALDLNQPLAASFAAAAAETRRSFFSLNLVRGPSNCRKIALRRADFPAFAPTGASRDRIVGQRLDAAATANQLISQVHICALARSSIDRVGSPEIDELDEIEL